MLLADKLSSLIKLRDITLEELHKRSGVSMSYISQIKNGLRTEVSNDVLNRLAGALGVNVDYFKISGAMLPNECIPNLPIEFVNMLAKTESLPFLKVTEKALKHGIPAQIIDQIIDTLIQGMKKQKEEP